MKKIFGTVAAFLVILSVSAQYSIKGRVITEQTNEPVEAATISVYLNELLITNTLTNSFGKFEVRVNKAGNYVITAEHISMQKNMAAVVVGSQPAEVTLKLQQGAYYLEPLEVRALEQVPMPLLQNKTLIRKQSKA